MLSIEDKFEIEKDKYHYIPRGSNYQTALVGNKVFACHYCLFDCPNFLNSISKLENQTLNSNDGSYFAMPHQAVIKIQDADVGSVIVAGL